MATTQQEQANTILEAHNTKVSQIRTDTTLSTDGKRAALAKQYTTTKTALDALAAEQSGNTTNRTATLERTVFGLPTTAPTADVVSYRDALDRVSSIDPTTAPTAKQLAGMYRTATLSGDTILGKAILSAAFDTQDVALINQYCEDNPTQDAAVTELWETRYANRIDPTASWVFIVPKPDELGNLDDVSIRALANGTSNTAA